MSREWVEFRWCEGIISHDQPEQAVTERTMTLDDLGPGVMDLCAMCNDTLARVEQILRRSPTPEQVATASVRPPAVRSGPRKAKVPERGSVLSDRPLPRKRGRPLDMSVPRPWPCPVLDCPHPGSTNRSAWGAHLHLKHGMGRAEADRMLAEQGRTPKPTGVK
jgi:hypothetical protein